MPVVELRDLRSAGAALLAGAAVLPLLPGHPAVLCPLRALTGVPCPLCGMTTSVVDSARGDVRGALFANPAGLAAMVLAAALLIVRPTRIVVPWTVVVVVLTGMWLYELHRFGFI
jgi:Protein of unknown function (DUF2752)